MPNVRTVLTGTVAGVALFAAPSALAAQSTGPVSVSYENGVLSVGTTLPGQPLVGATVNTRTGRVCAGFSYQMPVCATLPLPDISYQDPGVVTVDSDASDGSVGVYTQIPGQPLLSVTYYTANSRVCAGFSKQVPVCVQVGPIS
jgi:hypothetical protein